MKVLIVDDNVAIREIIAEILTVDGYEIRQAATVEDAYREIEGFRPDITLLDTVVEGKSMIGFVDSLDESSGTKIILLVSGKEQIPKDTPLIIGVVKKPFKSSEILEAVRGQSSLPKEKTETVKKEKFRIRDLGKSKSVSIPAEVEGTSAFGKSFVIYEDSPNRIYDLIRDFGGKGYELQIITSDRTKTVADKVNVDAKYVGITQRPKDGYITYNKLGSIMSEVMKHVAGGHMPAVVFDDLSKLVEVNGLNPVLTMIYQIVTSTQGKCALAISVKETLLTDKDKQLLSKYMERYDQ